MCLATGNDAHRPSGSVSTKNNAQSANSTGHEPWPRLPCSPQRYATPLHHSTLATIQQATSNSPIQTRKWRNHDLGFRSLDSTDKIEPREVLVMLRASTRDGPMPQAVRDRMKSPVARMPNSLTMRRLSEPTTATSALPLTKSTSARPLSPNP